MSSQAKDKNTETESETGREEKVSQSLNKQIEHLTVSSRFLFYDSYNYFKLSVPCSFFFVYPFLTRCSELSVEMDSVKSHIADL